MEVAGPLGTPLGLVRDAVELAGPLGTPLGLAQWKRHRRACACTHTLERHPQLSLATRGEDWARRDKKAFLSDQYKEIEENNRMGKTRDLVNIGEGNGTPLQYSCLENPMDGAGLHSRLPRSQGASER